MTIEDLYAQNAEMKTMILQLHGMLASPKPARSWYTVEEVAKMINRDAYTVREWCRQGRIDAVKRSERRGGAKLWSISAEEVTRYQNDGLLPADRYRNAG